MGNLKVKSLGIYQTPFKTRAWIESVHSALVVVAHPDDETLWFGGTMMMVPACRWRVVSLCRGDDPDRRSRFFTAMTQLNGQGSIGDMNDGHLQPPLSDDHVKEAIRSELDNTNYDLIVTHSLFGEYTTHLRHNEVGRAMLHLWQAGESTANLGIEKNLVFATIERHDTIVSNRTGGLSADRSKPRLSRRGRHQSNSLDRLSKSLEQGACGSTADQRLAG
ncbi:MAG: PIG-L family deacetylase [Deltaproteobacteria bacterium]|nr:PIG-L family deacetylase [Deltaproteobacteria bacterium]